jgi:hypothetical protein
MEQDNKTANETTLIKYDWQPVWKWINTTGFKMLMGFAGFMAVGVIILALSTNNPDTRANVLTVGILTILTIIVMAINAVATRQMVDIMDRQESEITKQRIAAETQAEVSDLQWRSMEAALKQTEQLFNLTERPLLGVERVICEPQKDEGCQITIALINSGKSIAKITNLSVAFSSINLSYDDIDENEPWSDDLTLREPGEPEEFLSSGIIHNGGRKLIPYVTMNAGAWNNIIDGSEQIYIWLKVQYAGINGGTVYFTEYYSYYNRFMGGFIECTNHNDAN